MIPRRFFFLFDAIALVTAFMLADWLAPFIRALVGEGMPLRAWLEWLSPARGSGVEPALSDQVWMLLVMVAASYAGMVASGGYRPLPRQPAHRIVFSALAAVILGLAYIGLVLFALKSAQWSRISIFAFAFFSVVGLAAYRLCLRWQFSRRAARGSYARNLVLVGAPRTVAWMARYMREHPPSTEFVLLGALFGPDADDAEGAGVQSLGEIAQLGNLLIHQPIHEVIAMQPAQGAAWLGDVIESCEYFRVPLHIVPEALLTGPAAEIPVVYRANPLRLPEVLLQPPDLNSEGQFIKRQIDILASSLGLVLLTPLLLVVAAAIKLTTPRLPVLYRYRQVGHHGRLFVAYKFTTMSADAEARKDDLADRNEMSGPVFKIKADPRVTPLGRFLRKFSINELPQLWNVLKGDLSLVGPRAALPRELARYELWHKRKLSVRPGLTCLWQVRGRNRISDFDDWVRMDFEYIDHWSLWLDTKILIRTVWVVASGSGS